MNDAKRNSTLEILRILSMCMILGLHYINPDIGGALSTTAPANLHFLRAVESACIPAVNVFVLISGYFLISRKTTGFRKAVELYLIMVIYDLLLLAVAVAVGDSVFTLKNLLIAIAPFAFWQQQWFLETYILLLLILPFLNLLIAKLNKTAHGMLVVIQLIFFSVWPSFVPDSPLTDNGYGIINFITLYLIAAYLHKHVVFQERKRALRFALLGYVGSAALITVSSYIPYLQAAAWRYSYLFAITAAVSLFLLFLNLPESHHRWINVLGGTTFDVYLSHAFLLIQPFVYHRLMQVERFRNEASLPLHMLICLVVQFAVFAAIGLIRQRIWTVTVGKLLRRLKCFQREEAWEHQVFDPLFPASHQDSFETKTEKPLRQE